MVQLTQLVSIDVGLEVVEALHLHLVNDRLLRASIWFYDYGTSKLVAFEVASPVTLVPSSRHD